MNEQIINWNCLAFNQSRKIEDDGSTKINVKSPNGIIFLSAVKFNFTQSLTYLKYQFSSFWKLIGNNFDSRSLFVLKVMCDKHWMKLSCYLMIVFEVFENWDNLFIQWGWPEPNSRKFHASCSKKMQNKSCTVQEFHVNGYINYTKR